MLPGRKRARATLNRIGHAMDEGTLAPRSSVPQKKVMINIGGKISSIKVGFQMAFLCIEFYLIARS